MPDRANTLGALLMIKCHPFCRTVCNLQKCSWQGSRSEYLQLSGMMHNIVMNGVSSASIGCAVKEIHQSQKPAGA
jgi:hypothetical protein